MKKLTKEQKRQAAVIAAKTDIIKMAKEPRARVSDKGECSAAARHELTLGRTPRGRGPFAKRLKLHTMGFTRNAQAAA